MPRKDSAWGLLRFLFLGSLFLCGRLKYCSETFTFCSGRFHEWSGVLLPGLDYVTCSGQWDVSQYDGSKGSGGLCESGSVPVSLAWPGLAQWSQEEDERHREQTHPASPTLALLQTHELNRCFFSNATEILLQLVTCQ